MLVYGWYRRLATSALRGGSMPLERSVPRALPSGFVVERASRRSDSRALTDSTGGSRWSPTDNRRYSGTAARYSDVSIQHGARDRRDGQRPPCERPRRARRPGATIDVGTDFPPQIVGSGYSRARGIRTAARARSLGTGARASGGRGASRRGPRDRDAVRDARSARAGRAAELERWAKALGRSELAELRAAGRAIRALCADAAAPRRPGGRRRGGGRQRVRGATAGADRSRCRGARSAIGLVVARTARRCRRGCRPRGGA